MTVEPDASSLKTSYAHCQYIARHTAGNFYYSFRVLPRRERLAMCALYTFMRLTDDLGDEAGPVDRRRAALKQWRAQLNEALAGEPVVDLWWLALADTVKTFAIPPAFLTAVIDGVTSDLSVSRYATFRDLYHYCYRVASAVGLACLRIWGVDDPKVDLLGEWCGIAFQLTNVLRDLKEDYARGRVYLPLDELSRFGVPESQFGERQAAAGFNELMEFQIRRANAYYERSQPLFDYLAPPGRAILRVMTDVYHGLLTKIERRPADVLVRRVSLNAGQKVALTLRALPIRFFGRPALTAGNNPNSD